jgi:hypothetical protein
MPISCLTDFRKRLLEGGAEQVLLDAMLAVFKERGWLKQRQRQRTDSTHVLAKTHLQHLGIAAAMNLVRVVAWLDGDELAPTRVTAFQRLYLAA